MSDWTSESDELRAENRRLRTMINDVLAENRRLQDALTHAVSEFRRPRRTLLDRWRDRH